MVDSFEINKAHWNEAVEVHVRSSFYGVAAFLAGEDALSPIESEEIGPLAGRRLLHLQCHFGLDTLCLARRGAVATGLDFAAQAVERARRLSREAKLEARFVEGNVYDAPDLIEERFEIVYVTWGALCWLPDMARWGRVVARMLEPGGFLYLLDDHPFASCLEQDDPDGPIAPAYDYFQGAEPMVFHNQGTYADREARLANTASHEWNHGLGTILTALTGAGLAIEWLHEHDRLAWRRFPCLEEGPDRMYRLPAGRPRLPLAFSLKARAGS